MRRSPAELFAKYLLLSGKSAEDVRQTLAEKQLDVVSTGYIETLSKRLKPPAPFMPEDRGHGPSQRYLVAERIRLLFHPDDDTRCANSLLDDSYARELAEALLISGATASHVSSNLAKRGFRVPTRAVTLYAQFYWNVGLVDSVELQEVVALRRGADGPSGRGNDLRVSAARSRGTSLGVLMQVLRSGSLPSNLQVARLLRATQAAAAVCALDATLNEDGRKAAQFATVLKASTEALAMVGDPQLDLQFELASVVLRTDEDEIPHVRALGGEHTVEMQPIAQEESKPDATATPTARP